MNMFVNFFQIEKKYWLIVLPILHSTIPWVGYRCRMIVPAIFVLLFCLMTFNRMFSKNGSRLFSMFFASFAWLAMYWFLPGIYGLLGLQELMPYWKVSMALYQLGFLVVMHYTFSEYKFREARFLAVIALLGYVIAGFAALKGLSIEGLEGARSITGIGKSEAVFNAAYDALRDVIEIGLGGYGYMYECAWLAGPLLFSIIMAKGFCFRALCVAAIIGAWFSIRSGGLATPATLFYIGIGIVLLWAFVRKRFVIKLVGSVLIVFFFVYGTVPVVFSFLSPPLRALGDAMEGDASIKMRIISVAETVEGNKDSYSYARIERQLTSLSAFAAHPIMGVYPALDIPENKKAGMLGGHSMVLDLLGGYGVLGAIPYFAFLYCLSKYFRVLSRMYMGERLAYIATLFIVLFVFGSVMNPTSGVPIVFYILLPGLPVLIHQSRGALLFDGIAATYGITPVQRKRNRRLTI